MKVVKCTTLVRRTTWYTYIYLNRMAFTGEIRVTNVDGMMSTRKQTANVPRFKRTSSIQSNCTGTNDI